MTYNNISMHTSIISQYHVFLSFYISASTSTTTTTSLHLHLYIYTPTSIHLYTYIYTSIHLNDTILTGVYVLSGADGSQEFVPTIPTPVELGVMLRYVFRQASLDSVNSWKRTALHVACDNNKVDSHARTIYQLIDVFGANTYLSDMHENRPMELLLLDRNFPGVPSATQVREEFILTKRELELGTYV